MFRWSRSYFIYIISIQNQDIEMVITNKILKLFFHSKNSLSQLQSLASQVKLNSDFPFINFMIDSSLFNSLLIQVKYILKINNYFLV